MEGGQNFSLAANRVLELALQEALHFQHQFLGTEHLLIGLSKCRDELVERVLAQDAVKPTIRQVIRQRLIPGSRSANPASMTFTPRVQRLFKLSQECARTHGAGQVAPIHLLLALLQAGDGVAVRVLRRLGHSVERLTQVAVKALKETPPQALGGDTPLLNQLGRDLTLLAAQGKLDPVVGRDAEIALMVQSLLRKKKNNLILVGDAGVGKTSLVEGLAQFLVRQDPPSSLAAFRIVEISATSLLAGTKYRGDLEQRVQGLLAEVQDQNIILFIDEFHTLMGRPEVEGGLDIANMLKPALTHGRLRMIGATTWKEYRSRIEPDPAFERRFQVIDVKELSPEDTLTILLRLKVDYERHHQVIISPESLKAAVSLSVRFLPHRRLPDKALDLLDQACANFRLHVQAELPADSTPEETPQVTPEDVALALAGWIGLPAERLLMQGEYSAADLEKVLKVRIVGQEAAVAAVASSVSLAQAGLVPPDRPRLVLLFIGPTGVGKTEMAKAMAEFLMPGPPALVRLDMSEFMEAHAVAKLVGAPPGYVGYGEEGQLTGPVRRKPGSVILFDEIDKAHPEILNLLLQILDAGQLTDSKGRVVNFRESYIIFTANATFSAQTPRIGFVEIREDTGDSEVLSFLRKCFRPEFLNRLDKIVIFHALSREVCRKLARAAAMQISQHLSGQNIHLEIDDEVFDLVLEEADFPRYGAREIKRVVNRRLAEPLSRWLLLQEVKPEKVRAFRGEDGIAFVALSPLKASFGETLGKGEGL